MAIATANKSRRYFMAHVSLSLSLPPSFTVMSWSNQPGPHHHSRGQSDWSVVKRHTMTPDWHLSIQSSTRTAIRTENGIQIPRLGLANGPLPSLRQNWHRGPGPQSKPTWLRPVVLRLRKTFVIRDRREADSFSALHLGELFYSVFPSQRDHRRGLTSTWLRFPQVLRLPWRWPRKICTRFRLFKMKWNRCGNVSAPPRIWLGRTESASGYGPAGPLLGETKSAVTPDNTKKLQKYCIHMNGFRCLAQFTGVICCIYLMLAKPINLYQGRMVLICIMRWYT